MNIMTSEAQSEAAATIAPCRSLMQAWPDQLAVDYELICSVISKLKAGRSGGEDGVAAEFLQALPFEAKVRLAEMVRGLLEGVLPIPAEWDRAAVALIPKAMGAAQPGAFRPITVVPVMLKVSMRAWLQLAQPFLQLRALPSHGSRPGYQAAEVHAALRCLVSKHIEWDSGICICKLDIAKAYDTLSWQSVEEMFAYRGLPQPLRGAYWRVHGWRRLHFRTEGAVQFCVQPNQGIPQGAPESPLVYAATIEMLIERATAKLADANRGCGLNLQPESSIQEVEDYRRSHATWTSNSIAYLNFADDTYVLARTVRMLEYQVATLAEEFASAGQFLHSAKCEMFASSSEAEGQPRPRLWTKRELSLYRRTGHLPDRDPRVPLQHMSVAKQILVLGSYISEKHQDAALPARIQVAWYKWMEIKPQATDRGVAAGKRIALLDRVILPAVMWGLESAPLPSLQGRKLDALQRSLVSRSLAIFKRSSEDMASDMQRRERLTSAAIRKYSRAKWSDIQRYRLLMFFRTRCTQ